MLRDQVECCLDAGKIPDDESLDAGLVDLAAGEIQVFERFRFLLFHFSSSALRSVSRGEGLSEI